MISLLLSIAIQAAPSPDRYFQEAMNAKEAGDFERAAKLADGCIEQYPAFAPCLQAGGLIYRHLANKNSDASASERSNSYLRRYIEIAPADDKFVAKARMLVDHKK